MDIRAKRKELKLTQEEFAERVGVSRSTVIRWEKGDFTPSRLAMKQIEALVLDK